MLTCLLPLAARGRYGDDFDAKAPIKLLDQWQYGIKHSKDAQVVVLSQVLFAYSSPTHRD